MNKKIVSTVILAIAVLMIFIGSTNGEVQTIFQKAILVCLECIGIN